jgi:hypothetical protein
MEFKDQHNCLQNIIPSLDSMIAEVYREDGPDIRAIRSRWGVCRGYISRLVDFAKSIKHIGKPYKENDQSKEISGEKWVVDLVTIQRDIDQVLASVQPGKRMTEEPRGQLGDLISRLKHSTDGHLVTADEDLRRAAKELYGLHNSEGRL